MLFFYNTTIAQDNYVEFTGTRVSMIVPKGFEKMSDQPVYFHNGSATSIQVKEVPNIAGVYTMMAFTKETLEQNEGYYLFLQKVYKWLRVYMLSW